MILLFYKRFGIRPKPICIWQFQTSTNVPRIHAARTAPRMEQAKDIPVAVWQERNWMWIRGLVLVSILTKIKRCGFLINLRNVVLVNERVTNVM